MKKLKQILCIGLASMLVFATPLSVLAKDTVSTEGLVPVRKAFEEAGIQVKWDNKTKTANIGYDGILKFTANKKTAVYDGILLEMNNPPKMINGKLYAEAAFLKNFFGENTSETDLIIPNYAIESMTGEYKTKLDIYQQPVVGEENFLAALKPQTGWEFAKDLAEIGSSDFGFRTGGTPEGKEAAELVYKKFEELKLEPEYDMFKLYGWRYLDSSFTFDGENIPVVSAVGTKGTSDKGITGEVEINENADGYNVIGQIKGGSIQMNM